MKFVYTDKAMVHFVVGTVSNFRSSLFIQTPIAQ